MSVSSQATSCHDTEAVTDPNQSASISPLHTTNMGWKPIANAPFDRDVELAVIDYDGTHALVFPCHRTLGGWIKAETEERIDVHPTHWREWEQRVQ